MRQTACRLISQGDLADLHSFSAKWQRWGCFIARRVLFASGPATTAPASAQLQLFFPRTSDPISFWAAAQLWPDV